MPTDLTGTPTTLGIGTFNVDADAPSGLGFNEAMAQIDALIAARIGTPAGIATGEAPVWNGTTWVRSSALPISASGLGGVVKSPYRKTSAKQVVNTVAETDLLNGEIAIAAGVLGTTSGIRFTAWGDMVNNSAATRNMPSWALKLGGTALVVSGGATAVWGATVTRYPWRFVGEIINLGVSNSQWVSLHGKLRGNFLAGSSSLNTGEGYYITETNGDGDLLAGSSSAIDTTSTQALAFTTVLPFASPALDVTLKGAIVEIL